MQSYLQINYKSPGVRITSELEREKSCSLAKLTRVFETRKPIFFILFLIRFFTVSIILKIMPNSQCPHTKSIKYFCIDEECTSSLKTGCEACFLDKHPHYPKSIISQQTLSKMMETFNIDGDVKPKLHTLKESINNYFFLIRNQFTKSIDMLSHTISDTLANPFLLHTGHLNAYKSIKKGELGKISKKEMKNFNDLALKIKKEVIQEYERTQYLDNVKKSMKVILKINSALGFYEQATNFFNQKVSFDKVFFEKIVDLFCDVENKCQKMKEIQKQSKPKVKKQEKKMEQQKSEEQNSSEKSQDSPNYQIKIIEVKRKPGESVNKKVEVVTEKKNNHVEVTPEKKRNSIEVTPDKRKKKPTPLKIESLASQISPNSKKQSRDSISQSDSKSLSSPESQNSEQMPNYGLIPSYSSVNAEKKKVFMGGEVKKMELVVPIKQYSMNEEIESPLLKNRKKKKEFGIKLFSINEDDETGESNEKNETAEIVENEENEDIQKDRNYLNENNLESNENSSVSLLIKSLPCPAFQAIPLLQESLKLASNNLSAAEYLSFLYLETSQPKQCLNVCNRILENLEGSPQAAEELSFHIKNNKAAALNQLGRYSESITFLQKCLRHKSRAIYFKNLADAYFFLGIQEKAMINYQKALLMNEAMDEAEYNLAVCFYMQHHMEEAKIHVQNAIRLNSGNDNYMRLREEIMTKVFV